MTTRRRPSPTADDGVAEVWSVDAGAADIARLDIPASAKRTRVFEIDVRFAARALDSARPGWLSMNVELDGTLQWSRRTTIPAALDGDSLDYHCRVELGLGRPLRVRASTQVGGAARVRLRIDAEESRS